MRVAWASPRRPEVTVLSSVCFWRVCLSLCVENEAGERLPEACKIEIASLGRTHPGATNSHWQLLSQRRPDLIGARGGSEAAAASLGPRAAKAMPGCPPSRVDPMQPKCGETEPESQRAKPGSPRPVTCQSKPQKLDLGRQRSYAGRFMSRLFLSFSTQIPI
jgi:hypothetical protein